MNKTNKTNKTDKVVGRKIIPTLLAIAAAFLVGSLAATGDATAKVDGAGKAEQSNLVLQAQQFQTGSEPLVPINTSFTYQGRLKDGANPANGQYDFEFKLFDALTGGTQVGSTITRANQAVSEGLVTVSLDFGPSAFQGQARYLEVAVRPAGGGNFTNLSPRQAVSPAPYAMSLRPGTVITNSNPVSIVEISGSNSGVYALNTGFGAMGIYGSGEGQNSTGVQGRGIGVFSTGVSGFSAGNTGIGVYGSSDDGDGVAGWSTNGVGVFGFTNTGLAGRFSGNVSITGNLSKGGGSFKIDHPLDPANKYLYHSFVESPDMMNIYNGNVTLDAKGEATVVMPEWFGALNKEFRYQLTAVGAPGPNLYISKKVEGNRFSIAGGTPGMEVSWQVTGIRKDAYAEKHRIPVEEDKGEDRGKYLYPTELGQPDSKGLDYDELQKMREQP